ncbi:hypothetical protein QEZ47_27350 [Aminobacter anthyllidis]|uniref:hypothetical protein n=1 Tax=Aminobacter anthyllidis TaxID=1035067 RepID=UPI002458072E|nr:hypothetical protein [Aminobacter anthyllidis]MDH4989156.1 hypothetical protein [Aminobacter anthyllidis]
MRWSIRHVLALMFAVLLAAGASLSAAQANNMAIQMAMASNMGMPVAGDCTACPDQGADDGKMTVCPQTCVGPVLALVPLNLAAVMVAPALDMMPLPSPTCTDGQPCPIHTLRNPSDLSDAYQLTTDHCV